MSQFSRQPWRRLAIMFLAVGSAAFLSRLAMNFLKRMPIDNPIQAMRVYLNTRVHAASSSTIPAFTIYKTERATSKDRIFRDGNEVPPFNNTVTSRFVFARRGDGSTADYMIHDTMLWPTDKPWDDTTIIDFSGRHIVHLFQFINVKHTFPFDTSRMDRYRALTVSPVPESDCLLAPDGRAATSFRHINVLGHEQILGFDTVKWVYDEGIDTSGNRQTKTEWHATALGCMVLKMTAVKTNSAGEAIYTTYHEPERIIVGEPDPTLFHPVADESKPSEQLKRRKQYYHGRDATTAELALTKKQDALYQEAQKRK